MKVSLVIPVLNEIKYIHKILQCIQSQTYPHSLIEVIFSDGGSTDGTLQVIENFKSENKEAYHNILLLNNIKKKQAAGVNLGFENANGKILCRVDAHSIIPKDYVENVVSTLSQKEKLACGGAYKQVIDKENMMGNLFLLLESSTFGSGIASFRGEVDSPKEVSSITNICLKKDTFEEVGKFNEKLGRSEDNEFSYRLRTKGYKIILNPKMNGEYYVRSSFRQNLKQKYNNGRWIGITTRLITYKMFSKYHFVPFLFFISLIGFGLLAAIATPLTNTIWFIAPITLEVAMYFIAMYLNVFLTSIVQKKFNILFFFAPFLLFLIHFSYGMGTLHGFLTYKKYR